MVKARKYVVKNIFKGVPKREDFEIVEYELPPLRDGEILVKAEWISVDPYHRAYNSSQTVPYDQFGYQVGVVQDSNSSNYPVGTKVVSHVGWCDYSILDTTPSMDAFKRVYKLPNLEGHSESHGIGAAGMPGLSAYFAFLEVCKPKAGDTVVVTGAAGAVGYIVGQIAKTKGCKVIGFAGSEEKVQWLEKEIGFDKVFNYKTVDVTKALKEAAPNGVDCYFDNVGGDLSSKIIYQMKEFGRVAAVGSISSYNDAPSQLPKATILQPPLVAKQIRIQGFIIWKWTERWSEGVDSLVKLIKNGKLKTREHITEGFDKIYDAFVGMLAGENFGKAVVKV